MKYEDICKLSNEALVANTGRLFDSERLTVSEILLHLKVIGERKAYADFGFSSLFNMLMEQFKLSESAAYQRVKALELMNSVPEVEAALVKGEVNLTTLATAQRQISRQEKVTGKRLAPSKKAEVVKKIVDKTQKEAEKTLFDLFPETAVQPRQSSKRISESETRLSLNIPDRLLEKLQALKDHWAHVDPNMDFVEVIERAADIALAQVDPVTRVQKRKSNPKTKPAGERPTYYSIETKRALWTRAGSRCEFVDPVTGRRCTCKFGLQSEHVVPIAMGGSNELSNLKLYCQTHNQLTARREFGPRQNHRSYMDPSVKQELDF